MRICDKCKKEYGPIRHVVRNYYPNYGFPTDTEMDVCETCKMKFQKYITKCYNKFFFDDDQKETK